MRLGQEQASGYVEDTVLDSTPANELTIDSAAGSRPAPVPEPAAVTSSAQPHR